MFFTSDNGPHREGGADPEFFNSAGPLRGFKRSLYEGGIRVPMIVRYPDHVAAGAVSSQVWAFWDVLPTLAELAGARSPEGLDGISMVPALLGETAAGRAQKNHEYLYWEFPERGFSQAVRFGDWKAVRPKPGAPSNSTTWPTTRPSREIWSRSPISSLCTPSWSSRPSRSWPAPNGIETLAGRSDKRAGAPLPVVDRHESAARKDAI